MCFRNRAGEQDYDDWGELGNPGWGWDSIFNSSLKSENFQKPSTQKQLDILPNPPFTPEYHGSGGPVDNSFPLWYPQAAPSFIPALEAVGIPQNKDPMGGENVGGYVSLGAVDQKNATRSYSATAYLQPNLGRKNLVVLTGAQATKVVLTNNKASGIRATSVKFIANGTNYEVKAKKEIILSAGSYQASTCLVFMRLLVY
jgi:choline dehydrogenase-like flavoprotein